MPRFVADNQTVFTKIYTSLTFLLNGFPVAAYLLLALAIAADVPVVGWFGVTVISLFGIAVLFLWYVLDDGMLW